jgi:hypothetical protein
MCHRPGKHRCNTVGLGVHALDRLARLPRFFPAPHPSSKHNACLDLQSSGHRFRFFLAYEGVQFIQLSLFDLLRHRSLRQLGNVLADPVGYTLDTSCLRFYSVSDLRYSPISRVYLNIGNVKPMHLQERPSCHIGQGSKITRQV